MLRLELQDEPGRGVDRQVPASGTRPWPTGRRGSSAPTSPRGRAATRGTPSGSGSSATTRTTASSSASSACTSATGSPERQETASPGQLLVISAPATAPGGWGRCKLAIGPGEAAQATGVHPDALQRELEGAACIPLRKPDPGRSRCRATARRPRGRPPRPPQDAPTRPAPAPGPP